MRKVFVDTNYWLAIVKPRDQWREPAERARECLGKAQLVTTDEVLAELLGHLCKHGKSLRQAASFFVREILKDPSVMVIPQSRDGFLSGLARYEQRPDKSYTLADCISMTVMDNYGMAEVLTNDHHFAQEGFKALMTRDGCK